MDQCHAQEFPISSAPCLGAGGGGAVSGRMGCPTLPSPSLSENGQFYPFFTTEAGRTKQPSSLLLTHSFYNKTGHALAANKQNKVATSLHSKLHSFPWRIFPL